jgi:adenosine deaminase
MKKIDLHVQFEGSLNITHINRLISDESREFIIKKDADNLDNYLEGYRIPIKLLQTRENLIDFTKLLAQDLIDDDILYAEVHLCPFNFTSRLSLDEVMEAIIEGLQDIDDIKIKLVLCMQRDFTLDKNLEVVRLAKKYADYVGGLSLVGDEYRYKTATFRQLFEIIRIDNIPFAIEAIEPESISLAVDFGATRIENALKASESEELITKIRENNTLIEIAPSFAIDARLCESMEKLPLQELRENNVKCYISAPNRSVSNVTLDEEYKMLKDNYKYLNKDLLEYNLNAIEGAFLGHSEKAELVFQLKK